jgi:acyl-CoA thioester hydrolase
MSQPVSLFTPHRFAVRVYYEDTDFSGFVYHASYLRFLERGRTEFLRELGIGHRDMFEDKGLGGFHFAVRDMALEFLKPALMDDQLTVETELAAVGGASIAMGQKILRGRDLLLTAKMRIAAVSQGRARRMPAQLLAMLLSVKARGAEPSRAPVTQS